MKRRIAALLVLPLALAACTPPAGPAPTAGTDPTSPSASPPGSPDATPRPSADSTPTPEETTVPPSQQELDTALIEAAWQNDLASARQLIKAGADVNATDDTVQSAYLIATSEGHLELLDLTLRHGADLTSLDSFDGTGLIRAAERGHAAVVGRLVAAGIEVDHVNNLGWVALHEALLFAKPDRTTAYLDTARVLVAAGADVTVAARRDGRTPRQQADGTGLSAQAALITKAQRAQDLSPAQANRRLLSAAASGDADEAALALRAGADPGTRNERAQTPLLIAAAADHPDLARLLVHLGANPDALDDRHDTPWLVTGVTGSVEMLETLLPADPDLTIRNRFGGLSPIPASERGHVDYVRRVVQTDVDLDHVNDLGWTALLEAVILGDGAKAHQQIVRILIEAGVDVSIPDRDGRTALDHARAKGYTVIAEDLEAAD